jgi:hypothetical protein
VAKVVDFMEDDFDRLRPPSEDRTLEVTYLPRPGMNVEELQFTVNGRLYFLGPGFRTRVPVALVAELSALVEGSFPGSQVLIISNTPKEAAT